MKFYKEVTSQLATDTKRSGAKIHIRGKMLHLKCHLFPEILVWTHLKKNKHTTCTFLRLIIFFNKKNIKRIFLKKKKYNRLIYPGYNGFWVQKLTDDNIKINPLEKECYSWYSRQTLSRRPNAWWLTCPCTGTAMRFFGFQFAFYRSEPGMACYVSLTFGTTLVGWTFASCLIISVNTHWYVK